MILNQRLVIKDLPIGKSNIWHSLVMDSLARPMQIPIMVAKGKKSGPILGLTAALHGDELNGISIIHRLLQDIEIENLRGTIVAIPVVNVPAFTSKQRLFSDDVDLNHVFPGQKKGNVSQTYAYRFFKDIVLQFTHLIDIHTASFGRINSYYIRADMDDKQTKQLAKIHNAQIIVHNPPNDGTLRGAAVDAGIKAITLEVGNPNRFEKRVIKSGEIGIHNSLIHLNMLDGEIEQPINEPRICSSSHWIYTTTGGLLRVLPDVNVLVSKGDLIAMQVDLFGEVIKEYIAPEDGIVIGKSTHPVNQTGGRILHFGILK